MRNIIIALATVTLTHTLQAEIITDGSLGAAATLQGPNYVINASLGSQYDTNLFHSFSFFNLTALESATFTGPETIEHIIGRVTGGSPSKIEGVLRSDIPGSQLWMINPAGWQQLGQVEVPGGLASAAAEALRLKDGGLFRAVEIEQSQLSSASPLAFLGVRDPLLNLQEPILNEDASLNLDNLAYLSAARETLTPEANACGLRSRATLSHFVVTAYRGMPAIPDSWQNLALLPLDFEPIPASTPVSAVPAQARISCNASHCDIRETLPSP
jgi:filamentous hemagglutinin family protein